MEITGLACVFMGSGPALGSKSGAPGTTAKFFRVPLNAMHDATTCARRQLRGRHMAVILKQWRFF